MTQRATIDPVEKLEPRVVTAEMVETEMAALANVIQAMSGLNEGAQWRILQAAMAFFGVEREDR